MKKIKIFLLLVMVSIGVLGCKTTTSGTKESLVIPITKDENSLTPFTYLTGSPGITVMRLVYDSLYTLDENNVPVPQLATSLESNDTFTEYKVSVKEGVKWHDGEALSTDDIKFSFEYPLTQNAGRWKRIAAKVDSIETTENTVTFKLKNSDPYFLEESLIDMPIFAKHVYEGKDAETINTSVGTGLYKMTEYVPSQKYVFEANDAYHGGTATVKTINMPIITDSNAIYQGIQSGEYTTFTGKLTPELVETFKKSDDLKVESGAGFGADMIYMNNDKAPFNDVSFRKAVSLAINNDEIIERVYLGYADQPTAGFYSPASPLAQKDLKYVHDVAAATKLLDESGYKLSGDVRLGLDGKPLEFELLTSDSPTRVATAQIVADQLKAIGVTIKVKSMDADTLDSFVWPDFDVANGRDYDLSIFGWSSPLQLKNITMVQLGSSDLELGSFNVGGYKDASYDALVEKYMATGEKKEKLALTHEMGKVTSETIPYHVFAYGDIIVVYNSKHYDNFVFNKGDGIINVASFIKK